MKMSYSYSSYGPLVLGANISDEDLDWDESHPMSQIWNGMLPSGTDSFPQDLKLVLGWTLDGRRAVTAQHYALIRMSTVCGQGRYLQ